MTKQLAPETGRERKGGGEREIDRERERGRERDGIRGPASIQAHCPASVFLP